MWVREQTRGQREHGKLLMVQDLMGPPPYVLLFVISLIVREHTEG